MNTTQKEDEAENIIYTILSENAGLNANGILEKIKEMAQQYHKDWNSIKIDGE